MGEHDNPEPSRTVVCSKDEPFRLTKGSIVRVGGCSWKIVRINKKTVTIYHGDDGRTNRVAVNVFHVDYNPSKYSYELLDDLIKAMGLAGSGAS